MKCAHFQDAYYDTAAKCIPSSRPEKKKMFETILTSSSSSSNTNLKHFKYNFFPLIFSCYIEHFRCIFFFILFSVCWLAMLYFVFIAIQSLSVWERQQKKERGKKTGGGGCRNENISAENTLRWLHIFGMKWKCGFFYKKCCKVKFFTLYLSAQECIFDIVASFASKFFRFFFVFTIILMLLPKWCK